MANVKTITATTTESTVEFSATYQFMWFRNFGENDCYICAHSGIVAGADDVTVLKAGEVARLTLPQAPAQNKAYIKAVDGSNTVEVHAQNFSDCPFKKQGKGGEQITVESLTATENTTYTAPTGMAYSPVTVNVPTGAEIITRSAWNALTTEQKQAKGLVAIQDSSMGFDRGELVNGANYVPINYYIPNSSASDVLCSAHENMFNANSYRWGDGSCPVMYNDNILPTYDSTENAVSFNALTDNTIGFIDRGAETAFTVYVVMRGGDNIPNLGRLISCMKTRNTGYGMMFININSDVVITSWASDTATGVSPTSYFVGAIKYSVSGSAGYIYDSTNDNVIKVAKSPSFCSRYITIGTTDRSITGESADPADVKVKYLAVVDSAETDEVVEANIINLYNEFLAE